VKFLPSRFPALAFGLKRDLGLLSKSTAFANAALGLPIAE
jgi:hypothetical protein